MAIRERDVAYVSVGDLLAEDLRIPHYQRSYAWEPRTATQLLDDILDARATDPARPYVLGAVILHRPRDRDWREVVDGQQRLLTLSMLLDAIRVPSPVTPRASSGKDATTPPVVRVRSALNRRAERIRAGRDGEALATYIGEFCQVVKVETDDLDEAFRIFDSQNYRGKPLKPHDLLKAYHLREMGMEPASMQAAVVEGWESVEDEDLDRLFSTYLYRIRRWARGERALGFSVRDIDMFKGITRRDADQPASRYHRAAQASLPVLQAWTSADVGNRRDQGRSRFQLDAPVVAGRPFFEMASFMLSELKELREEAFDPRLEPWASSDLSLHERPGMARYRYVSELFLAALLYYTNKFSDEDIAEVRDKLFVWAYNLRLSFQRVQLRSIDNHARRLGDPMSVFPLLRNAASDRDLRRRPVSVERPALEGHETELAELLRGIAES